MSRILTTFACVAALTAAPRLAAADTIYDTVDSLDARPNNTIRIVGIVAGAAGPTTTIYNVLGATGTDQPARCDRLALLAMAKPGKFQLVLVQELGSFTCRLRLRTP